MDHTQLPRLFVDPATYYDADYWTGRKRYRLAVDGGFTVRTYDPPAREWGGFSDVVRGIDFACRFGRKGRVLDIGCGSGSLVAHFVRAGYDARGIDVSDDAIANPAPGAEGRVTKHDLSLGPPGGQRDDIVTATDLLEHIYAHDAGAVVRGIVDLIQPGSQSCGFFCIATAGASHEEFVHTRPDEPIPLEREWQAVSGHVNVRPHDYWVDLFESAGAFIDWRAMHRFAQFWAQDQSVGKFGSVVSWGPRFILVVRT